MKKKQHKVLGTIELIFYITLNKIATLLGIMFILTIIGMLAYLWGYNWMQEYFQVTKISIDKGLIITLFIVTILALGYIKYNLLSKPKK